MMMNEMAAESYKSLWQQVEEAQAKDLPKTEDELLLKIVKKAKRGMDYGHLLKAELMHVKLLCDLTPDSIGAVLEGLEKEAAEMSRKDGAMAAVYYSVLGNIYKQSDMLDDHEEKSQAYYRLSLADPALLARKKSTSLEPMVERGEDSEVFGYDLLSLLGYQAEDWNTLYGYYSKTGNRRATLLTALKKLENDYGEKNLLSLREYADRLDKLIEEYGDLEECGEAAIARFQLMPSWSDEELGKKMAFSEMALERWGGWKRMNVLRNARLSMTQETFAVETKTKSPRPGERIEFVVNKVRHLSELSITITKTTLDGTFNYSLTGQKYKEVKSKLVAGSECRYTRHYDAADYVTLKDTVVADGLEPGVYLVEVSTNDPGIKTDASLLYVSNLTFVNQTLPGGNQRIVVLNATTGHPVKGASVEFWDWNRKKHLEMRADEKGELECKTRTLEPMNYVFVSTEEDKGFEFSSFDNNSFRYYGQRERVEQLNLYSDRSIYRPGQTARISMILMEIKKGSEVSPIANQPVTLTLKDANYQTVKEETVVTDDFGTAWVDFDLPRNGLTGQFTVSSNRSGARLRFHVEEYKRPTFEVVFDDYEKEYKRGDTVTVTGHARSYAGIGVQGAKVKYTVKREKAWWCWWRSGSDSSEIVAEGETVTDETGTFSVDMPMVIPSYLEGFFHITALCDVTDQGGESHEGKMSLPLGWKDTDFYCNLQAKLEREDMKDFTFIYKNAAGKDIPGKVTYTIDGAGEVTVDANTPINLKDKGLSSGQHVLEATCGENKLKKEFIIFSLNDQTPCIETPDWFYQKGETFDVGKPAWVQLGSSDEQVYVLYTLISGDKLLESGSLELNNSVNTRRFDYQETYGAGVLLNYVWVKNGKVYTHQASIEHPLPDKQMKLTWTTFRDRLTPGQQETWTLHIDQPSGSVRQASPIVQVMATLYDKSLDQLYKHSWSFPDYRNQSQPWTRWYYPSSNYLWLNGVKPFKKLTEADLDFSVFTDEVLEMYFMPNIRVYDVVGGGALFTRNRVLMSMAEAEPMPAMMPSEGEVLKAKEDLDSSADYVQDESTGGSISEDESTEMKNVSTRENLQETAFFYPALTSDKKGNVKISFTLPESLTTWRFIGLAHDQRMNYGIVEAEAIAQKEVMVQPNMPRFVRQGDQATIVARLVNTTDHAIEGKAALLLIDPETEQTVWQKVQPFSLKAEETGSASFQFSTSQLSSNGLQPSPLYICKVVASGEGFSDGEQHYLPVLPNREQTVTTVPFTQHEAGTKEVDLSRLFAKGDPVENRSRLTIEYTNNPAWLIVQALPYVGNPYEKNAISLAAAYYSNAISLHLLNQSPQIKNVFKQWQQEKGEETSLMSQLEKNQDLKTLVINETPWVMDAQNESSQRRALGNYFDENTINYNLQHTLDVLMRLQNGDGSFSWWDGMPGSPSMTAEVMEFLTRLNLLTGNKRETEDILETAHRFLSDVVVKEVDDLKRLEKEKKPIYVHNSHALQWVYINAISGRNLNARETSAKQWLIDYLKKQRTSESLYAKALMAVVLAKDGEKALAKEYLQSLEEYSVSTEEMGRYYETKRAGYSWFDYRIPTQVAAIEAFTLLNPEDSRVPDEMRRWLLMSKRTQAWDTPVNSVNAVYAFLNGRTQLLKQKEATTFKIDNETVEMSEATSGIGYVKSSQPYKGQQKLVIEKTSTGTSWGGIYAQQWLPMTEIEQAGAGLSVKRELFFSDGKPIPQGEVLKTGQRIKVRISITADRDYDFVQVCDKRAACMEPLKQLSGYHWGCYTAPKDEQTCYYFDQMSKGLHVVETEYYVDREGLYETGTCTVQCAYSPEYSGRTKSDILKVSSNDSQ